MSITLRSALAAAALIGACALTACAGGASPVVGVWGDPDVTTEPSVEFLEDGTFNGTDGCNRVMGDWSAEGDSVEFGPMVSTMMYCEGVDVWLTDATSAVVSGSTLTFSDEAGGEIGSLTRHE